LQDRNWNSFAYILDNHGFVAGTFATSAQATDTVLTVRNVAPSIDTSTIFLYDPLSTTSSLYLSTAQGQTSGFLVKFTVVDNNSCSSTFNFPEVVATSTVLNLYRSGVTQASCQVGGNYDPNSCYPSAVGTSTWNYSCVQDVGSCGGSSDPDATFTCTFPLWYVADPTDGVNATDTTYFAENWKPSVRISDDNASTTFLVEGAGNELASYLAYSLNTLSINFGSLSPGSSTDPIGATSSQRTVVSATGNVGLDHTIYGDHMCTTYPTCSATSPTSTIQIYYQRFATSSVGYASASAFTASSTPGTELEINIKKTTVTSTPATGTTYWGIAVSSSITLAGDYTGQDTIIGIKGEAQFW
jgi:hypothetical protein